MNRLLTARSWVEAKSSNELIWVSGGSLSVWCLNKFILVPDAHGVWIPRAVRYQSRISSGATVQNLLLHRSWAQDHLLTVMGVDESSLGLALTNYAAGCEAAGARRSNAEAVIVDVLTPARTEFSINLPIDSRLREILDRVLDDPAQVHSTSHYSAVTGVSPRHLTRLFRHQTGLSWAQWRFSVTMLSAVSLLSQGFPVGEVSYRVGYATPSRFSEAFLRMFAPPTHDRHAQTGRASRRLSDSSSELLLHVPRIGAPRTHRSNAPPSAISAVVNTPSLSSQATAAPHCSSAPFQRGRSPAMTESEREFRIVSVRWATLGGVFRARSS